MSARRIGRDAYREVPVYLAADRGAAVDLSDNTNLWGAPPAASRALVAAARRSASRYPSAYTPRLAEAIARYAGVDASMVVTGCGSDDVLDCAFRALAAPGESVAYADPTFVVVPAFSRTNSLVPAGIPWRASSSSPDDLALDADALLASGAAIIYLCSPNNPTGTVVPPATIERIVMGAPGAVIVDEAYFEFGGWTAASLLPRAPHLLVTRTLSKAFGLAGLRVGYGLGDPALLREIAKARGPYKLASPVEDAAIAALEDDGAWVRAHVDEARAARARLTEQLRATGAYRVLESAANFVLALPAHPGLPDARAIDRALRERGVAVRAFPALAGLGGALRITVGPWPMMQALLDALPLPDASA